MAATDDIVFGEEMIVHFKDEPDARMTFAELSRRTGAPIPELQETFRKLIRANLLRPEPDGTYTAQGPAPDGEYD